MTVLPRGRPAFDAQDEGGALLGPTSTINFIGAGVSVAYNAALDRFDVTIPGSTVQTLIQDADADTRVRTEAAANENKIRMAVGGTERYLMQTASPHHDLTGDLRLSGVFQGYGVTSAVANNLAEIGGGGDYSQKIGLQVGLGSTLSVGANVIIGVGGYALCLSGTPTDAIGLDYIAGMNGVNLTRGTCVRAQIQAFGAGVTLTDARDFWARSPSVLFATLTNAYGYYVDALAAGTNRYPFYDAGTTASGNVRGNVFKTNTQLFQTTLDFGAGAGVLGIGVATTAPTTNPTGGMIVYVDPADNKLKARGQAGTVTVLAVP